MSTRLRPIVMISDSVRAGGHVRMLLEDTARALRVNFPPRGAMPEVDRLIEIFRSLPLREVSGQHFLWIFREPKSVSSDRSRYMQLCRYYGLSPSLKKKKLFTPDLNTVLMTRQMVRERQVRERQQAATQAWNQTVSGILGSAGSQSASQFIDFRQSQPERTFSLDWESINPFIPEREP